MIHSLQNTYYQLTINLDLALWSLYGFEKNDPVLKDIQMGVHYHTRYSSVSGLRPGTRLAVDGEKTISSPHGPLRQVELVSEPDKHGLSYRVIFALAEKAPLMLTKMIVENRGNRPLYLDRLEFLNAGFVYVTHASLPLMKYSGYRNGSNLSAGSVILSTDLGEPAFFSNGWQSWSYTGVYGLSDRFRRTRLGSLISPMRVNAGTPHHKRAGLFSSDMFGVIGDRVHRKGILIGFLSQTEQFGSIEALLDPFDQALRVWANGDGARLDPGMVMETDWFCVHFLHLDSPDPLGPYLDAVALQHGIRGRVAETTPEDRNLEGTPNFKATKTKIPTGWCSWYQYYQMVTAQDIRSNLSAARSVRDRLPLELIQIDDGFEAKIGDWLDFSPHFPEGVEPLSREINAAGFFPGLWLAPYILHRKSRLAREHPEWLLRNRYGLPVNAGFIWDTFTTSLDLTHPEALAYTCEIIQTAARKWGYTYLKLDFLYAAALPGRYKDRTRTRAQVLRQGLQSLRQAAGEEVFLLGCGCPLGSGIGIFDAMRIGSDVDARWRPAYKGLHIYIQDEPDLPSIRNALQNALTRAPMHNRWWVNDPDCLLLRADSELTLPEVQTMAAVIALTGGSLFLSDAFSKIPPERLKIVEALLPLIGKTPHILDWFDKSTPSRLQLDLEGPVRKWHLIGLFNWSDRPEHLKLNLNDFYIDATKNYHVRSFWDGKIYHLQAGKPDSAEIDLGEVPAHGSTLLCLRRHIPGVPQYIGSDLHISQGLEVASWQWVAGSTAIDKGKISGKLGFSLERPGIAQGRVYLYLPLEPHQVTLDGLPVAWSCESREIYSMDVNFNRRTEIEILL
jgi:alpha-galactosidase